MSRAHHDERAVPARRGDRLAPFGNQVSSRDGFEMGMPGEDESGERSTHGSVRAPDVCNREVGVTRSPSIIVFRDDATRASPPLGVGPQPLACNGGWWYPGANVWRRLSLPGMS